MGFIRNPGQRGDVPEPSGGPAAGEHTLLGFTLYLILDLLSSLGDPDWGPQLPSFPSLLIFFFSQLEFENDRAGM